MALLPWRVQQSTSTAGTGTLALNAVAAGRRSFNAAYGSSTVRVPYVISGASYFEMGYGDYDGGTPGTLTRATVLASSNAGALVSLPAGTADVFPFIDPADRGAVTGTGAITLTLADLGNLVLWTGSSAVNLNLPAVATVPEGRGWLARNSGTATLTIDPNASETVDGATTLALYPGETREILRVGSAWITAGGVAAALSTGTLPASLTTLVTSGTASIGGAATVAGAVSISGATTVDDDMTVTGAASVTGMVLMGAGTVTGAGVRLGQWSSTLAATGSRISPDGLVEKWGFATLPSSGSSTASVGVTFAVAFPTAVYGIFVAATEGISGGNVILVAASPTASGFTIAADSNNAARNITNTVGVYWRAWGK